MFGGNPSTMKFHPIKNSDDVRKLQAEMQQARNQQFTLGTVAITAFGLSAWLLPRPTPGSTYAADMSAAASIALLVLFWLMLRWTRTLWILITIISRYLELREVSEWEGDFREFTQPNKHLSYRSQSRAVSLIYLILGVLVPAQYLFISFAAGTGSLSMLDWVVVAVSVLYLVIAVRYAFGKRPDDAIVKRWEEVLASRHPAVSSLSE